MQWCFDGVSPPLVVGVSDPIATPSGNGKFCYVVYVSESDAAPHFINGRKGVWVRTDEFSARFEAHLADENELRHLFDRRKVIHERREMLLARAKQRFDIYAGSQTDRGGQLTKSNAQLELSLTPRFPSRPLCDQENLDPLIARNMLRWRGVEFPMNHSSALSQHESVILLRPVGKLSIFEANVWGMLFYSTQIDGDHNGTTGIHLLEFVGYLLAFIHHAGSMLSAMGCAGPVLIEMAMASILQVQWIYPEHGMWLEARPGSQLDDSVQFSINSSSEALRETPDRVVTDLLRYALFSLNWRQIVDTAEKLENLIRGGYTFNGWRDQKSLRI